jgi:hypothetical protein
MKPCTDQDVAQPRRPELVTGAGGRSAPATQVLVELEVTGRVVYRDVTSGCPELEWLGLNHPKSAYLRSLAHRKYLPGEGPRYLNLFVDRVNRIGPAAQVDLEFFGLRLSLLFALGERLRIARPRLAAILDLPADAGFKALHDSDPIVLGSPAYAAVGLVALLGATSRIVEERKLARGASYDAGGWLGRWLETQSPALDWCCPSQFLMWPDPITQLIDLLQATETKAFL